MSDLEAERERLMAEQERLLRVGVPIEALEQLTDAALLTTAEAEWLAEAVEEFDLTGERRCRGCGCTDTDCSQCIERTGLACSWVEADLCSACVSAA